jgi:predicted DNA-binding transcriptional regulator AlpA
MGVKIMQKSNELFDIHEVGADFGLSESSVRRRVRDSREGRGNFPLPLFKSGCRVLWKKSDILAWSGEDSDILSITPSPIPSFPKAIPVFNAAQTRKALENFGINLPPPTGNETSERILTELQQECKSPKKK